MDPATDAFDRIYAHWAGEAAAKRMDPPSRERWDAIVLRLISSEDPDRVRRYSRPEATGPESLGADAYELWLKLPEYTPNRTIPLGIWPDFASYEKAQRGSMRRYMEAHGLLSKYNALVGPPIEGAQAEQRSEAEKARARNAQARIVVIGCVGMSLIAFMALTVLLIMALRMAG